MIKFKVDHFLVTTVVITTPCQEAKWCHFVPLFVKVACVCLVTKLCSTLCNPIDCSPVGSSLHQVSRQEHWNGLPCPPPGDLPDPGISPALACRFFTTEPPVHPVGEAKFSDLVKAVFSSSLHCESIYKFYHWKAISGEKFWVIWHWTYCKMITRWNPVAETIQS